jgi:hypothetical protein
MPLPILSAFRLKHAGSEQLALFSFVLQPLRVYLVGTVIALHEARFGRSSRSWPLAATRGGGDGADDCESVREARKA